MQKFHKFSSTEDLKLVASVKKHPVLYNHEGITGRNVSLMKEHWKAVSEEIGITEESCKRRWRDIRDHYFKLKRKEMITKKPSSTKWSIFYKLSFLESTVRAFKVRSTGNADPLDQEEECLGLENPFDIYDVETSLKIEPQSCYEESYPQLDYVTATHLIEADTSFCQVSETSADVPEESAERDSRRSQEAASCRVPEEGDDVDMFMKSIALTVKKFAPKQIAEAKMKILSLVTELQFPGESLS